MQFVCSCQCICDTPTLPCSFYKTSNDPTLGVNMRTVHVTLDTPRERIYIYMQISGESRRHRGMEDAMG